MTTKRKPGAGAKPKNYPDIQFKENLTQRFASMDNISLLDEVLSLCREVAKTNFETARLEFEIANKELRGRLKKWLEEGRVSQ